MSDLYILITESVNFNEEDNEYYSDYNNNDDLYDAR